jgi:hypothetical protein
LWHQSTIPSLLTTKAAHCIDQAAASVSRTTRGIPSATPPHRSGSSATASFTAYFAPLEESPQPSLHSLRTAHHSRSPLKHRFIHCVLRTARGVPSNTASSTAYSAPLEESPQTPLHSLRTSYRSRSPLKHRFIHCVLRAARGIPSTPLCLLRATHCSRNPLTLCCIAQVATTPISFTPRSASGSAHAVSLSRINCKDFNTYGS